MEGEELVRNLRIRAEAPSIEMAMHVLLQAGSGSVSSDDDTSEGPPSLGESIASLDSIQSSLCSTVTACSAEDCDKPVD